MVFADDLILLAKRMNPREWKYRGAAVLWLVDSMIDWLIKFYYKIFYKPVPINRAATLIQEWTSTGAAGILMVYTPINVWILNNQSI